MAGALPVREDTGGMEMTKEELQDLARKLESSGPYFDGGLSRTEMRALVAEVRRLLPMEERLAQWERWSANIDNATDDEILSPEEPYLTNPPKE